jgi:hypothetical protein
LEKFAEIWADSHVKGRVVHDESTSHTLGIGVKYDGSSSWAAGGKKTVSSSFGYDSNYSIANAAVKNKVWHRYHYASCLGDDGEWYRTKYTKPAGFHSGPYYAYSPHQNHKTCEATYAGHEYRRTSGKNGTYTGGVDLPFINLSAQSGWTSTTEVHWRFERGGKLCGSDGGSWTQARRIDART